MKKRKIILTLLTVGSKGVSTATMTMLVDAEVKMTECFYNDVLIPEAQKAMNNTNTIVMGGHSM